MKHFWRVTVKINVHKRAPFTTDILQKKTIMSEIFILSFKFQRIQGIGLNVSVHYSTRITWRNYRWFQRCETGQSFAAVQNILFARITFPDPVYAFQTQGFCFNSLWCNSPDGTGAVSATAVRNLKDIDSGCFPERKQVMTLISNFSDLTNPIITSENVYTGLKPGLGFKSQPVWLDYSRCGERERNTVDQKT